MTRTARPLPDGPLHLVGIGGAGQSALALVLAATGRRVTGSDRACAPEVRARLEAAGVRVHDGHAAGNVGPSVAAVIASDAVPEDNPELAAARERGVAVFRRPEALAAAVAGRRLVAVAGTHGKTTTTGMVAQVLCGCGIDPTVLVGGDFGFLGGGNARAGGSDWAVVEACEAYGGLDWLTPRVAVLTSLDPDHLDYHGTEAAIRDAFVDFARRVPAGGAVVWCADDPVARERIPAAIGPGVASVPYRVEADGAGLRARAVVESPDGASFAVDGTPVALRVPGRHNVANALGAWGACAAVGVAAPEIAAGLGAFGGAGRRFERLGERDGVLVIDDYAHHPTEIRAALAAARAAYPDRRLVAVFQPHLPSRTLAFFDDFADALAGADRVYLAPIYLAREAARDDVTSEALAGRITGPPAFCAPDLASLEGRLRAETAPGDLLLIMGAGDIRPVGENYLRKSGVPA